MIRWRTVAVGILLFAVWLFAAIAAYAMDVQPLRVVLVPGQGQTSGSVSVNNTRSNPLPYEVTVERRFIDENGQQRFESAEDDFLVFPPQGLIAASGTQAVRFQYLGEIELSETQGYVLRIKEVPVRDPDFSGIQFAYSFGAAVYVKPQDAKDRLEVRSFSREGSEITAELENIGNDYSLMTAKRLRISVGGENLRFERDQLSKLIPNPLIAPGGKRILKLTIEDLPEGELEEFRFN